MVIIITLLILVFVPIGNNSWGHFGECEMSQQLRWMWILGCCCLISGQRLDITSWRDGEQLNQYVYIGNRHCGHCFREEEKTRILNGLTQSWCSCRERMCTNNIPSFNKLHTLQMGLILSGYQSFYYIFRLSLCFFSFFVDCYTT